MILCLPVTHTYGCVFPSAIGALMREGDSMRIHSTIWVCRCCMLVHANGECCEGHAATGGEQFRSEVHPSARFYASTDHYVIPANWALWGFDQFDIAMGGEHVEGCLFRDGDCTCVKLDHVTTECQGCGNPDHGERHAFTVFYRD